MTGSLDDPSSRPCPVLPARRRTRGMRGARLAGLAAAVLLMLVMPATALAHAAVETSDPAAGATLPETPALVTIDFTERLDPALSSLALAAPDGTIVATGGVAAGDPEARQMALRPPALALGVYTVRWTAASSDDGNVANGSYTFTIVALTPRPSAAVTPTPTAAPASTPVPTLPAPASPSQAGSASASPSAPAPATTPRPDAGETGIGAQPIAAAIVAALGVAVVVGGVVAYRRRRVPRA